MDRKIIFQFLNSIFLFFVICAFFIVNVKDLYAQGFAIDRIWTSDVNGNVKSNFMPGDRIRYNADISITERVRFKDNRQSFRSCRANSCKSHWRVDCIIKKTEIAAFARELYNKLV